MQCAVSWARRGKQFRSGHIAPSNSSIETRSRTRIFSRIGAGGHSSGQRRRNVETQCAVLWARRGKNSRAAISLPLTAASTLAAVPEFSTETARVVTAAGKAGAIPKSSVPSCGRGVGKNPRAAKSLPLTSASQLAPYGNFQLSRRGWSQQRAKQAQYRNPVNRLVSEAWENIPSGHIAPSNTSIKTRSRAGISTRNRRLQLQQ